MQQNNSLIKTDGIFYRIKKFFLNIFKKDRNKNNGEQSNTSFSEEKEIGQKEIEKKEKFLRSIGINKESDEDIRIKKLQDAFKRNMITEESLSAEDRKKLHEIYDKQILNLIKKIKQNIYIAEQYKKQL